MANEAAVLNKLAGQFPALDAQLAVVTERRIFVSVPETEILHVLRYAKEELGFTHLSAITGLDTGNGYEFLYHISGDEGILLNVKYKTGGGEGVVIPSVLPLYEGATFYERELEGLLGVHVDGLPEGRQYPLPDNWPAGEYPMRKDWVSAKRQEQA